MSIILTIIELCKIEKIQSFNRGKKKLAIKQIIGLSLEVLDNYSNLWYSGCLSLP